MVRPINKRVEKVFLFYEKGSAASLEAAWKKHGRPTSLGNVQRQYHKCMPSGTAAHQAEVAAAVKVDVKVPPFALRDEATNEYFTTVDDIKRAANEWSSELDRGLCPAQPSSGANSP